MDIRNALIILHIIGTAIGVGAATVIDYLVFKFARDKRIDKDEFQIINTISNLVWIGLFLLLVSGLGFVVLHLYNFTYVRTIYSTDKIWAKLCIVVILTLNGFFIHYRVLPTLKKHLGKALTTSSFIKKSFLMFTPGAVSSVSWYSALVLGGWRGLTANLYEILLWYACIVTVAIFMANVLGKRLLRR